jgi:uncharacterized protein YgfB (UPF0149 family)
VTDYDFDYRGLAALLDRSGSPLPLPELHGGLCGVICAGGRDAASRWLDELLDDCTADAGTLGELARDLGRLGTATWTALNGLTLEFEPYVPDADDSLAARAEGLALWCHGFLSGLVVGGLDLGSGQTALPPELAELVGDLAEISRAGSADEPAATGGSVEDPADEEESLTELLEYVRVGVQFIFEELTPGSDQSDRRVLH